VVGSYDFIKPTLDDCKNCVTNYNHFRYDPFIIISFWMWKLRHTSFSIYDKRERERERERWGEEGGGVEANRPSKNKGV
jgi:hypothetical protein